MDHIAFTSRLGNPAPIFQYALFHLEAGDQVRSVWIYVIEATCAVSDKRALYGKVPTSNVCSCHFSNEKRKLCTKTNECEKGSGWERNKTKQKKTVDMS